MRFTAVIVFLVCLGGVFMRFRGEELFVTWVNISHESQDDVN